MRVFPIIKCVGVSCNLRCTYCYHAESDQCVSSLQTMPLNTVRELILKTADINKGKCHCLWHGGEPLLAGINFFRAVVALQKQLVRDNNICITNSIQTNGTLIDSQWAQFFKDEHFRVGVSIDGPAHMHNQYRKCVGGQDSFEMTLRGITECQNCGYDVGVIVAVNDYNVRFPKELYSFLVSSGIKSMSFNPVYEIDGSGALYPYSVTDEAFGRFLLEIFDLWISNDDPNISIRQFTDPLTKMCGGNVSTCIFSGLCSSFLEVYPDGSLKPCHGFRTVTIGNILQEDFSDIFSHREYRELLSVTQRLPKLCYACKWFPVCGGGCCDHRGTVYNSLGTDAYVFCNSRKEIFSVLKKFVDNQKER